MYICENTENYDEWVVQNIKEYSCKICVKFLTFIWCSVLMLKRLLSPFNVYVNVFVTFVNSCVEWRVRIAVFLTLQYGNPSSPRDMCVDFISKFRSSLYTCTWTAERSLQVPHSAVLWKLWIFYDSHIANCYCSVQLLLGFSTMVMQISTWTDADGTSRDMSVSIHVAGSFYSTCIVIIIIILDDVFVALLFCHCFHQRWMLVSTLEFLGLTNWLFFTVPVFEVTVHTDRDLCLRRLASGLSTRRFGLVPRRTD